MKWLEYTLTRSRRASNPRPELLSEYGIDSLMIDEEGDFKDFLENNHQYWDYVDDELMEQMHGKSRITFYLEDSAEGYNTSRSPHRSVGLQKAASRVRAADPQHGKCRRRGLGEQLEAVLQAHGDRRAAARRAGMGAGAGGRARQACLKSRIDVRHRAATPRRGCAYRHWSSISTAGKRF